MMTHGQLRAQDALAKANAIAAKQEDKFKKSYRSYIDRLAPAIIMNGLGQAMAMELAAAGGEASGGDAGAHHQVYLHLQSWLCDKNHGVYKGDKDLLEALLGKDQDHYLRAQSEALQWLEWHKKFCRAKLPRGEEAD